MALPVINILPPIPIPNTTSPRSIVGDSFLESIGNHLHVYSTRRCHVSGTCVGMNAWELCDIGAELGVTGCLSTKDLEEGMGFSGVLDGVDNAVDAFMSKVEVRFWGELG